MTSIGGRNSHQISCQKVHPTVSSVQDFLCLIHSLRKWLRHMKLEKMTESWQAYDENHEAQLALENKLLQDNCALVGD